MAPITLKWGPSSNPARSKRAGSQQVINGYAEPLTDGKSAYAIYPAPGLVRFAQCPTGPFRGALDVNGRMLVASGRVLYDVDAIGTVTEIAGLPGNGPVQMARNALADPDVMMVADGRAWHWKAGQFKELETDVLPTLVGVVLLRGRFVFAAADGRFFYSRVNSVVVDGDAYYNAEGKPDGLSAIWQRREELILLGTETAEQWAMTQDEEDPMSRIGGGALPVGCINAGCVAENNDDVFWVDNKNQVRRLQGGTPQEISPPWVVRLIADEPDKSSLFGQAFTIDGHNWYGLSGSTFTIWYNLGTNHWIERKTGDLKRWRGQGAIDFAGRVIVGDHESGDLWELTGESQNDGDIPIYTVLRSAILHSSPTPLSIYTAHIDLETRTEDDDPEYIRKAMLRLSDDGGKSWDGPFTQELGRQGETERCIYRQLGTYEKSGATLELSFSARDIEAVTECVLNGVGGSA